MHVFNGDSNQPLIFFIVYTENYVSNNFMSKNKALVLKWTYWINL